MSSSKFVEDQTGANALLMGTPDNHAIFPAMNTPIYPNQPSQLEAYPLQFGTVNNHATNHGLGNVQLPRQLDQPDAGANALLLGTQDNHAIFPSVNTPIYQNPSAQLEAYRLQFGTVANCTMNHGLGNVQLPHQLDQPEGAINMMNPSMRHQMNLCRSAKPGSSQSSNISDIDMEKILKKRESDRKYRGKKEQTRKDNEEMLAKVTAENKHLKEDNARLLDGLGNCQEKVSLLEKEVSDWKKKVSSSKIKLKRQNTKVEALEKLVASSAGTDPVAEIKQLKRKIELLMTQLTNPDSMKIVEIQEEKEKWERKAKRLQVINDALCDDKMNNDEK